MLLPMAKVHILGRRVDVGPTLGFLQRLELVQVVDARSRRSLTGLDNGRQRRNRVQALQEILERTEALLVDVDTVQVLDGAPQVGALRSSGDLDAPETVVAVQAEVNDIAAALAAVDQTLTELHDEQLALAGYVEPLRRLFPLVPVLAGLDTERLRRMQLATVALVLDTDDPLVVAALQAGLAAELGDRFELVIAPVEKGAIACLAVIPSADSDAVHAILGQAAVRSVALPSRYSGLSLRATVDAMQRRLDQIPDLATTARAERDRLLAPHLPQLLAIRGWLATEIELLSTVESVGATARAFVVEAWVPRERLDQLRTHLAAEFGTRVYVEQIPVKGDGVAAPVLMRNAPVIRPFEPFVRFLELPRARSVDPTLLMAIFLPLMFGAMVGDIGYGAVLLALGLVARRKLAEHRARVPEIAGIVHLLVVGAAWSIVFGLLFGEFFGDLGKRMFGDWALWQYRPSAGALEPLLIFAVVLGAAHVVLGLGVGAWQAVRFRAGRDLLDKIGSLVALAGLFGLAGLVVGQLPRSLLTPSVAAVVVGLVVVMSLHGVLGLATGPLDLLGRIGNILSYLRLAAVGLASAHLAGVANQLGSVGPIWMGLLIALFFHALNLALAAFSPMIQALRLQYVEFFGTFFVGGGREFAPFGESARQKTVTSARRP